MKAKKCCADYDIDLFRIVGVTSFIVLGVTILTEYDFDAIAWFTVATLTASDIMRDNIGREKE